MMSDQQVLAIAESLTPLVDDGQAASQSREDVRSGDAASVLVVVIVLIEAGG
jgi:hypothetical protein